ncbi:GntR family transcriptional regulator [Rhizobiales bacterium]|uniref:GntR family transcriptional regulator n=1 Tax=Hongsoonwoonella zoysiae TaxID=2821844 RepID=UPI0015609A4D|nr:GntR family transcriptional regulator [Hongsoonwoonella zoysiae]NRG18290.1 GntR family transcriptional regulator [Hongsoonwoonella zoysiae]
MLQGQSDHIQEQAPESGRFRSLDAFSGSLAARTYMSLREAILDLRCRPGELLRKAEICETLGISRSPAAEAITRLAAEGLVDVIPQAGTFVARFSMDEIREGAFLREAIELAAIEALAPVVADEQLVQLRRNIRVQEVLIEDGDYAGFYKLDREFHEMVLSFTGYRKLGQVAESAWVHVNRARRLVLPVPGRVAATLDEHRAILTALEKRDPELARKEMRGHLRQLMTFLAPLEKEHPDLFEPKKSNV